MSGDEEECDEKEYYLLPGNYEEKLLLKSYFLCIKQTL